MNARHLRSWIGIVLLALLPTSRLSAFQASTPLSKAIDLNAGQASMASEYWYGELDAGARMFRFLIELKTSPDEGSPTATLTSLDEGNAKFKLDEFKSKDKSVSFLLKATRASYAGTLDESKQLIEGKWKQGVELKLDFQKVPEIPKDLPKEVWQGTMKAGFQTLEMQLRGYEGKEGAMSYFVDSVSQKAGGFKAKVDISEREYSIEVPALKAKYTGRLNESRTEISGKWKQLVEIELNWKKGERVAEASAVVRRRPQNPVAPFPYESREVTFANEADGVTLSGTLTLPNDVKSPPLAILISGSGPQDRDETILGHRPFWVIADHFARKGIAVLRFDERGVGKSTGAFEKATTLDFSRDVVAAVAFARSLSDIDTRRIGLIGHSEGGLIAPIVASNDPKLAWVILLAGPGVNGEEILYSQGQLMIAAEGGTPEMQKRQLKIQKETFQSIRENPPKEKREAIIKGIVDKILDGEKEATKEEREALEQMVRANWEEMAKPWFKFFVSHEPGPVLEKVQCPVLALNGAKDTQVDPKLNLPKIEEHLKRGGNRSYRIVELPELNHLFQTCKHGGLSEYESIEETISPSALQIMSDWIIEQP